MCYILLNRKTVQHYRFICPWIPPTKECLFKYRARPTRTYFTFWYVHLILETTILSSNCLATNAASCQLFEPLETTWTTWKIAWDKVVVTSKSLKETTIKKAKLEKFYTVRPNVKSSINFCCRPHYILLWHSLDTKKAITQINLDSSQSAKGRSQIKELTTHI